LSSARLRVILRILIFRNISAFHDKNGEGRNSETEMQYRRANPVCGLALNPTLWEALSRGHLPLLHKAIC
ncbi:hypothetical protein, partial [Escherichia coli]